MQTGLKFCLSTIALSSLSAVTLADVGALDKYECHDNHDNGEYHCHGPEKLAKLGGIIIGADSRFQAWSTNDDLYLFLGFGINAEYNHNWFAATGSYFFMPLVTSIDEENVDFDDTVYQSGFELGVKAGPGVGRYGSKSYLMAGWSVSEITDSGDSANNGELSGYYVGAGFGYNSDTLTFDLAATYRDPSTIKDYLEDLGNFDGDVSAYDVRASLGWRF